MLKNLLKTQGKEALRIIIISAIDKLPQAGYGPVQPRRITSIPEPETVLAQTAVIARANRKSIGLDSHVNVSDSMSGKYARVPAPYIAQGLRNEEKQPRTTITVDRSKAQRGLPLFDQLKPGHIAYRNDVLNASLCTLATGVARNVQTADSTVVVVGDSLKLQHFNPSKNNENTRQAMRNIKYLGNLASLHGTWRAAQVQINNLIQNIRDMHIGEE
jgi:hypothetical protein